MKYPPSGGKCGSAGKRWLVGIAVGDRLGVDVIGIGNASARSENVSPRLTITMIKERLPNPKLILPISYFSLGISTWSASAKLRTRITSIP